MHRVSVFAAITIAALLSSAPAAAAPVTKLMPGSAKSWGLPSLKDAKTYANVVAEGVGAAAKGAKTGYDLGESAHKFDTLTANDKRLEPDYQPQGAPAVPSKCMENKACRPCYTQAYDHVNATRRNLEKVRAHYDYTHRFTTQGKAFMQGVAGAAGNAAAIGAMVEAQKIDESVDAFDAVVRSKNAELLAKLQQNLREVSACEAKFYKNEDWYDRYGYMYYQFMSAHYDYAQKN